MLDLWFSDALHILLLWASYWRHKCHPGRLNFMQKGQNWLFTPTQPFSLVFGHCTFTFQKKNMWHLLENSTWCALHSPSRTLSHPPSPSVVMYSPLNSKSIQHFQNFSYVTWAHPDICSTITQLLNLGGILRRSPPDPDGDFCLFLGAKLSV